MTTMIKIFALAICIALLSSCAKVGSERWCAQLKDTPKAEWSLEDATNFSKHCLKF